MDVFKIECNGEFKVRKIFGNSNLPFSPPPHVRRLVGRLVCHDKRARSTSVKIVTYTIKDSFLEGKLSIFYLYIIHIGTSVRP